MAGEYLRELLTVLGFDLNETGFKRANGAFQSLVGASAELVSRVTRVGMVLFDVAAEAADAGDKFRDVALQLGITVEEVQELAFAGEAAGVGFDEMTGALKILQRETDEARRGNAAAGESFRRLGGNVLELVEGGASTPELFAAIADRVASISDPAERTALAMQAFGRGGATLIPLLKDGSKGLAAAASRMRELGEITTREAELSDQFNDTLGEGRIAIKRLTYDLGFQLIPMFKRGVEWTIKLYLENRRAIRDGFEKFASAIESTGKALGTFGRFLIRHKSLIVAFAATVGTILLPVMVRLAGTMLAAAAPAVALGIVLAGIALILDDAYGYANGVDSALGRLIKNFRERPMDVNEHWLITTLRSISEWGGKAVEATDTLFSGFAEDMDKKGFGGAVLDTLTTAGRKWVDVLYVLMGDFLDWFSDELPRRLTDSIEDTFGFSTQAERDAQRLNILQWKQVDKKGLFKKRALAAFGGDTAAGIEAERLAQEVRNIQTQIEDIRGGKRVRPGQWRDTADKYQRTTVVGGDSVTVVIPNTTPDHLIDSVFYQELKAIYLEKAGAITRKVRNDLKPKGVK